MKHSLQALVVRYPIDDDLEKRWFIRYPNPAGGLALKKYGNLNKIDKLPERLIEVDRLIAECNVELNNSTYLAPSLIIKALNDVIELRMSGRKKKTQYGYTSKLKVFTQWFRTESKSKLSRTTGIEFLTWLKDKKKLSNVSINGYRRHMKSFFEELVFAGNLDVNPFNCTKKLAESVSTKSWYRLEMQKKLKKQISTIDPQLWLACLTQFYCFIRPGDELMGLTIADIIDRDLDDWKFRISEVNAKTGKFRFVQIARPLRDILEPYIEGYADHLYIFGKGGNPSINKIGRNTLYNRHRIHLASLNLPKGYTFYSWKNTGAVMMYKNGMKMKYISLLMGHSSIEITDMYFKSLGIDDVMYDIKLTYPVI